MQPDKIRESKASKMQMWEIQTIEKQLSKLKTRKL